MACTDRNQKDRRHRQVLEGILIWIFDSSLLVLFRTFLEYILNILNRVSYT